MIAPYKFFQAESEIRDSDVTGVQTCTLPILTPALFPPWTFPATVFNTFLSSASTLKEFTPSKWESFTRASVSSDPRLIDAIPEIPEVFALAATPADTFVI